MSTDASITLAKRGPLCRPKQIQQVKSNDQITYYNTFVIICTVSSPTPRCFDIWIVY